jgi:hypothetical protein
MIVTLEKFASCDDWFYLIIDDVITKTIFIDDVVNAVWNELEE